MIDRDRRVRTLQRGEIHVYRIDLDCDAADQARLARLLSAEEEERARRFVNPRTRSCFTVCRGALRRILGSSMDRDPRALDFFYGRHGKPMLLPGSGRHSVPAFSVSHSGALGLIAVGIDLEIGVDIEHVRHLDDAVPIARRFFSPPEAEALMALPPEEADRAFLRCWTRKEAYIKGLGDGLERPLDSFQVDFSTDHHAALLHVDDHPSDRHRWTLAPLHVHPDYVAAVAVTGAPAIVTIL